MKRFKFKDIISFEDWLCDYEWLEFIEWVCFDPLPKKETTIGLTPSVVRLTGKLFQYNGLLAGDTRIAIPIEIIAKEVWEYSTYCDYEVIPKEVIDDITFYKDLRDDVSETDIYFYLGNGEITIGCNEIEIILRDSYEEEIPEEFNITYFTVRFLKNSVPSRDFGLISLTKMDFK